MVGQHRVLLHLVHFLGVFVRGRVLGAVDDAGRERLVDFGERHHLRDGAERAHLRLQHLGGLDAHLESAEVRRHAQRLVGAHVLKAVVPIGEADDALRLQQAHQLLAERSIGDLAQRRLVRKDERQIEHLELLDADRSEFRVGWRQHLHRAELQRFELFLVLVELRVRIDFDLHLAVGVFLGQLLEFLCGQALRRVGRHHVAELDDDRSLRERRPAQCERSNGAQHNGKAFHGVSFRKLSANLAE